MSVVFQYAVKVVCGKSDGKVVAPGEYWTAVNVNNPNLRSVKFRKKIAIALPSERAGPVTDFFSARLGPGEALEIDRADIYEHAKQFDFIKGFVTIESGVELDVVAVYTAAGSDGRVETLDIERVAPRRLTLALPDLVPVPDDKGYFCRMEGDKLIVTVKNQGGAPAGASVTMVDFGTHGTVTMPTPQLAAGASVNLYFAVPKGCFDPDCEFQIIVDCNHQIMEGNETNNSAKGSCIG